MDSQKPLEVKFAETKPMADTLNLSTNNGNLLDLLQNTI
jgi:hypothetical protein